MQIMHACEYTHILEMKFMVVIFLLCLLAIVVVIVAVAVAVVVIVVVLATVVVSIKEHLMAYHDITRNLPEELQS